MPQIKPKQMNLATAGSLLVGGTNGTGSALSLGTEGQILKVLDGVVAWSAPPSADEIISADTFDTVYAENNTGVVISVADSTTAPTKSIPLMTFSAGSASDENLAMSSSAGMMSMTAKGTADDVGISLIPKGAGNVVLGDGTGGVVLASKGSSMIQSDEGTDLIISGGDNSGNLFITHGANSTSKVYYATDASDSGREVATLNDIKSSITAMTGRSQFTGDKPFDLPEKTIIDSIVVSINGLIIDATFYSSTDNGTNIVVTFSGLSYTLDSSDEVIFTYNLGG